MRVESSWTNLQSQSNELTVHLIAIEHDVPQSESHVLPTSQLTDAHLFINVKTVHFVNIIFHVHVENGTFC